MGNYNCNECFGKDSNIFNELCLKKVEDENNVYIQKAPTIRSKINQIGDKKEKGSDFSGYRDNKAVFACEDNQLYNKINSSAEKIKGIENKYEYSEKIDNKDQFIKINPNSQFLNQTTTEQSGKIIVTQNNNGNNNEENDRWQHFNMAQNIDNFNKNENINQLPIQSPIDVGIPQSQEKLQDFKQDQLQQQYPQQPSFTGKFKYQLIETYEPVEYSDSKQNSSLQNDENGNYKALENDKEDELLKKYESHRINNQNINLRANINPQLGVKLFAEDRVEAENKKNEIINKMNINEPRDSKRKSNISKNQNLANNYYNMPMIDDVPIDSKKNKNYYYDQQLNNSNEPRNSKSKKNQSKFQNNNIYGIPDVNNNGQNKNEKVYISSGNFYNIDQKNYEEAYVSSGNVYDNQNKNDYDNQQKYYYQENNNNVGFIKNTENQTKDSNNLMKNHREAVTLGPLANDVNEIEYAFSMQNKNADYVFDQNQQPFAKADDNLYENQENNIQGTEFIEGNYNDLGN